MSVLKAFFGTLPDQKIQDFAQEVRVLRDSCPPESTLSSMSFKDFVEAAAKALEPQVTVDWTM